MYTHSHQVQSFKAQQGAYSKATFTQSKGPSKPQKKRKDHRELVPKVAHKRLVSKNEDPQLARKVGGRRYKKVRRKKAKQEGLIQTYKTQMLFAALCVVVNAQEDTAPIAPVEPKMVAELTFLLGPEHASVKIENSKGYKVVGKFPEDRSKWICDGLIIDESEKKEYHESVKVRKSVPLSGPQLIKVLDTIKASAKDPSYLAIGDNCVDFAQSVYKASGEEGHFATHLNFKEIEGKAQAYAWMRSHKARSAVIDTLSVAYILFSLMKTSQGGDV